MIAGLVESGFFYFVVGVAFLQGILRFPQCKNVVFRWLLVQFCGDFCGP
jgi:hypothetical protein